MCRECGRDLPAAFPGGRAACACGHVEAVPSARPPRSSARPPSTASGPYRGAPLALAEIAPSPCPYCGNACPPLVRVCPHCDVRLEAVRCARCFSLQGPGTFACTRCGDRMELEPLLDATDAPCPRCARPLEAPSGGDGGGGGAGTAVHECARCGGIFVPRDELAEILCRAELAGALPETAVPRATLELEVRYLPCPLCHASMNRVNFGKLSGVVVDVCKAHGTWFDAGELTRAVAFASAGGLTRARAREAMERDEKHLERAAAAHVHASFVAGETGGPLTRGVGTFRAILEELLFR